ncbi:MAG: DMT family transporter [Pseudomonadota bacterium]
MTASAQPAYTQENLPLGGLYALASFLCLAAMSAFAKAAGDHAPTIVIVFFQNFICLVLIAPFALRHGLEPLKTRRAPLHLLRAVCGTGSWFGLFVAISMVPLANAVLLTYSAPLWMPLIAWLISRQRIGRRLWIGMVLGFVGVVLVLHPSGASFNAGALFALGAAILLALTLILVRRLSTTEPTTRILFYYFLLSSVITIPPAIAMWAPVDPIGWVYMAAIGLCFMGSQVFIILAYRQATAVKLGPLIYSVIVFTALINWLVWSATPTWLELAGMACVIIGGVVAVAKHNASAAHPS